MHLLFATDRLHVPDDQSGSVQTTHALALAMHRRGHRVEVVASLPRRGRHFLATALHRLSGRRWVLEWTDRLAGYPTHRGSEWRADERTWRRLVAVSPDVLLLDSLRRLRALASSEPPPACPVVVMIHDPGFGDDPRPLPEGWQVRLVANSPHTAARVADRFGIQPAVVPPLIDVTAYRTERPSPRYATLVTPHPAKGLDLVLELAALVPDQPFLLVEGWPMDRAAWEDLQRRIGPLPNVTLRRSTADIRTVYRDTRVLLMASGPPGETFGRVIVEAQASGIPVVTRDAGAQAWVAGEGGAVLAANAPAVEWADVLRRILASATEYERLSRAAVHNADRADFRPDITADRFEALLRGVLANRRS